MSKSKPTKPKPKKPTPIAAKLLGDARRTQSDRSALYRGGGKPNSSAKTFSTHRSKNG